ncbi:hypothetical protein AAFC00_000251 [Neodothiora populina]|uniref:Uncharacterized protein n=1 Tax=Neodothiora populina TaxID=2781224 RepID=A0ABR3P2E8_9PEZI
MSPSNPSPGMLAAAKTMLQKQPRRPSIYSSKQDYLTGLRGILAVQSFVWLFFQTFIPALVSNSANDYASQPTYQVIIRKVFSPLLWDESLIYSFFIILSARTVCIHFLQDASTPKFARTLISRPIRVGIPISIALACSIAIFSAIDVSYIAQAASVLKSSTLEAPRASSNAITGFNSIYDLLWVYQDFALQAGNQMWPSGTLWVVSVIYFQSWTVFAFMVILPFTRPGWHLQGLIWFGLGSFWFNTWGWYSAVGLLVADLSLNPALRSALGRGIRLPSVDFRMPYWSLALGFFAIGTALKYVWVSAFPSHINAELSIHPAKHLQPADGLGNLDSKQPYPRLDNFLVILGTLLILELSERAQSLLSFKVLRYLGSRSLSIFVSQSILLYTAGLKIFIVLVDTNISTAGAKAVVFVVCLPATLLGAELFHRAIDQPSQWFGQAFFRWTRN